jgi:hypothetical protein
MKLLCEKYECFFHTQNAVAFPGNIQMYGTLNVRESSTIKEVKFVPLTKHYATKTYGGGEWSASRPCQLTPG